MKMAALEIMKDFFFIERGYLNGNHFVYRSKAPILIDTGYASCFNDTEKLLGEIDIRISDVSLIINTHCHCDHIGGNRKIQKHSGCDIALHRIGKHFIDTGDDWSTWWRYYDQEADFFRCTIALNEGETVDIGVHRFRVIHTPGHASDGIALYSEQEKILISSDALWEEDIPAMTLRVEGNAALFQVTESLEKLASLDVKVTYPGHGRPFRKIKEAIEKSKKKVESYMCQREKIGENLLKRIIVYTLLMRKEIDAENFFPYLMGTLWFKETIDLYFNGEYERKYNEIIGNFMDRGIIKQKNRKMVTTVKP